MNEPRTYSLTAIAGLFPMAIRSVNNCGLNSLRADGSQTQYLYDATGRKLRTIHRVASVPVSIPGSDARSPLSIRFVTDYCDGIIYEDSIIARINFDGGYLSYTSYSGKRLEHPEYHFYIRDHLGNNRVDMTSGSLWQTMDYYPFGLPMASSFLPGKQRWQFGGKEMDRISGLDMLDFEARPYDPATGRFTNPDPLAETYTPISPYTYCASDPINLVDPTGMYTLVAPNSDGTYKVIGGKPNNDLNIYICEYINGNYYNTWQSIGQTATMNSFYNSDIHEWAEGAIIDPNDNSGVRFISQFRQSHRPSLKHYISNAGNNQIYDFKVTNGTSKNDDDPPLDIYRGMKLFHEEKIYGSARDIGNIIAGYYCGLYDIKWAHARVAFDLYQSKDSTQIIKEGTSSKLAQLYGYALGKKETATLSLESKIEKCFINRILSSYDETLSLLYLIIQICGK